MENETMNIDDSEASKRIEDGQKKNMTELALMSLKKIKAKALSKEEGYIVSLDELSNKSIRVPLSQICD